MITIEIGDKLYNVKEAKTKEERSKGLSGIKELPEDEGMLFYLDDPNPSFWMKDTLIPLDIVFINDDCEVISVHHGKPNDETPIMCTSFSTACLAASAGVWNKGPISTSKPQSAYPVATTFAPRSCPS